MFRFFLFILPVLCFAGCPEPDAVQVDPNAPECDADHVCPVGQTCENGVCMLPLDFDSPDPETDGGSLVDGDAGAAPAETTRLEASDDELEFGGQRLGISVTQEVTVTNVGTLPVTLVA